MSLFSLSFEHLRFREGPFLIIAVDLPKISLEFLFPLLLLLLYLLPFFFLLDLCPFRLFDLPSCLLQLLMPVFFSERLTFPSVLVHVPVFQAYVSLTFHALLGLAPAVCDVFVIILLLYVLLFTVSAGFRPHEAYMCSQVFLRELRLTVLAWGLGVRITVVFFFVCLWDCLPTLLTTIVATSASNFMHAEFRQLYLLITS